MTQCCSCSPTPRAAIAHGPDPGSGGLPRQDPLPEKGSNGNATVTDPNSVACGHLLEKYDGGATTFNLRGLDSALRREVELEAGAYEWVKDYIYRDGLLLASQHRTEGHQHYHLDHLGTTRMLTNRCGERVKRYELLPYGDTISAPANDTETRRFTGHQRDLGSPTNTTDDLEYMHARYYGVKMGRLLSVDPGEADAWIPGSWNRYSYAYNSPTVLADPDGEAPSAVLTLPLAAGGTSTAAVGGALLATGAYGASAAVMIYFVVAHAEPLGPAQVEQIQAVNCHTSPAEARRKRENPAKPVSSHPPADASGETTTPPPPPADPGGGRTGRKVSRDQRDNADRRIEKARQRWREADSKPNKTPEDKAKVEKLRRELDRLIDKKKASEEHARWAQHS